MAKASASAVPPSTSALIDRISFCIAALSWPLPTISKDCTSGIPAASMVASWRMKTAISPEVIVPDEANNPLLCLRIRVGTTPWRRRSARTAASSAAIALPLTFWPFLSVPSQIKGTVLTVAASAISFVHSSEVENYSIVTRLTSSRLVTPSLTLFKPARRKSITPSLAA